MSNVLACMNRLNFSDCVNSLGIKGIQSVPVLMCQCCKRVNFPYVSCSYSYNGLVLVICGRKYVDSYNLIIINILQPLMRL